jgi:hypothetical protein
MPPSTSLETHDAALAAIQRVRVDAGADCEEDGTATKLGVAAARFRAVVVFITPRDNPSALTSLTEFAFRKLYARTVGGIRSFLTGSAAGT